MKRLLAFLLCALMLVPFFAFQTTAAEYNPNAPFTNVAEYASTGFSSKWNNDSDAKFLNNGVYYHSYEFWRPSSSHRDPAIDDSMQYCELKFSDYYEINQFTMYAQIKTQWAHIKCTYTIKALVSGEWVVLATLTHNDGEPYLNKDGNPYGGEGETMNVFTASFETVNTKRIRIECTDYGTAATGSVHDWWIVPSIHEVELTGRIGPTPEYDVPEGAMLSSNACLGGMAGATSTRNGFPSAKVNDNSMQTGTWKADERDGDNQSVWVIFDKAYAIGDVLVNLGGVDSRSAGPVTYDISIMVGGAWTPVAGMTGIEAEATEAAVLSTQHRFQAPTNAEGVMITFTSVSSTERRAVLTELGATIATDKKCMFLGDYLTADKKQSTATGNLACFGTAYASSTMTYASIAEPSYIIDGLINADTRCWFGGTFERGIYCGVTLNEINEVNKVALYFNDTDVTGPNAGDYVLAFDVQAKVNGTYRTVASGTSFDEETQTYIVSLEFEAVRTNDIRIVFTSNANTFPYLRELEVFGTSPYSGYVGYSIDSTRTLGGPALTTTFAEKSYTDRCDFLEFTTPIQYMDTAFDYGVQDDGFFLD